MGQEKEQANMPRLSACKTRKSRFYAAFTNCLVNCLKETPRFVQWAAPRGPQAHWTTHSVHGNCEQTSDLRFSIKVNTSQIRGSCEQTSALNLLRDLTQVTTLKPAVFSTGGPYPPAFKFAGTCGHRTL